MSKTDTKNFGQYKITEKIAQGGMAEIFKGMATDANGIEKTVVIKRILPHISSNPEFVEMLIDEAKIAVQLSHGNIAKTFDLGKVGNDYFIVMEYVDGKTLSQIMRRLRTENKQIPIEFAVYIASEIASGLDYMHRKTDDEGKPLHIVHRDISPQNIIISTTGNLKIIDFGIAKARMKSRATESGVLKGKFAYMSPEHAGGKKLDQRSDIFSLGVILYELLTGLRLFKGKNNAETLRKVKNCKVDPPSTNRSGITEELNLIVLKALQKDPAKRYLTSHAFQQDLVKLLINYAPNFTPAALANFTKEIFIDISYKEDKKKTKKQIEKEEAFDSQHESTPAADKKEINARLAEWEELIPEKKSEPENKPKEEKDEEEKKKKQKIKRPKLTLAQQTALRQLIPIGVAIFFVIVLTVFFHFGYKAFEKFESTTKRESAIPIPKVEKAKEEFEIEPEPKPLPEPKPKPAPVPPSPIFASVSIKSTPPGAAIFLNDKETGLMTPSTLKDIDPTKDNYIGLYLKQYKFWKHNVELEPGITSALDVPLELNYGALKVQTIPEKADVYVNDEFVGNSPLTIENLPPGTALNVQISLEKYKNWSGRVKIFAGKAEVISVTLEKERPLP